MSAAARTVVVVYATYNGVSDSDAMHQGLLNGLRAHYGGRVDVFAEFVDVMSVRTAGYEAAMTEYLRSKFADRKVDAIVACTASGVRFASKLRREVFPDAAFVHMGVERKILQTIPLDPDATGATFTFDPSAIVTLARQLVPDTENVAVVIGATDIERLWAGRIRAEVEAGHPDLQFIALGGLEMEELLGRLATLPPRTLVMWIVFYRDAKGAAFVESEALQQAHAASNAPIFGFLETDFGHGIVGGGLVDIRRQGEEASLILGRIFSGEPPASIPPVHVPNTRFIYDWKELRRWNIDESRLPPGAEVRGREPGLWELYGWYIAGSAVVILVQGALIAGLLAARARRRRAQLELAERLNFERLIVDITDRLADVAPSDLDDRIARGLEDARALFGVDLAAVFVFGTSIPARVEHSVVVGDATRFADAGELAVPSDAVASLRAGSIISCSEIDDLPDSLSAAREAFARRGLRSVLAVPLQGDGRAIGAVVLATVGKARAWAEDLEPRFRIFADVFANALVRRQAAEDLRRSEALSGAVLASLSAQVAVIDRDGLVIAANASWHRFGAAQQSPVPRLPVGENLLEACRAGSIEGDAEAGRALAGLESVLVGAASKFVMEYSHAPADSGTWYAMGVEPLDRPEGGAVVMHRDISTQKQAELDAEHGRQQLAHVTRVSTMGELAASLAHELNQPLTGVLTNAETAIRLLAKGSPDLVEIREILDDIVSDDKRAGEVIRRLRAMLQMGQVEPAPLNLNLVVAEVRRLVATDAIIRGVTIELQLEPDLPAVVGDRIQMQQVVLNLAVNGMDAMKHVPGEERSLTIRTELAGEEAVRLSVADRGSGIRQGDLARVFKPFFTTKGEGLGMGLAIARTIVETHGGTLEAANNIGPGATFTMTLRVDRRSPPDERSERYPLASRTGAGPRASA